MARLISEILNAREPAFTQELKRLEKLAGHPKIDVRLIGELVGKWQELAAELGLDRQDTTARELYFALRKKALEENDLLSQKLNVNESDPPETVIKKCASHVESLTKTKPVWGLKSNVIKSQLKSNPPKKLLKTLGLRSVDSALKREPIAQLVVFAEMVESKGWREAFISQAAKLKNSDFDRNHVEITVVDKKRAEKMRSSGHELGHLVYRHNEVSGIIIVPPKKRFHGDVLFFVDTLLRESNEIRRWSSFVKYISVRNDFGKRLSLLRAYGLDAAATQHFSFGWSPVHQLLHDRAIRGEEPLFEPHLDHDDVLLPSHDLGPIWQHRYLLKTQDGVVFSCNVSDVIVNAANSAPFEEASSIHGQRELFNELFARYLAVESVLDDFARRQA